MILKKLILPLELPKILILKLLMTVIPSYMYGN